MQPVRARTLSYITELGSRNEELGFLAALIEERVLHTGGGIHADIYTDMPVPDVTLSPDQLGHLVLVPTPDYSDHGDFDLVNGLVRRGVVPTYTFGGIAIDRPELSADCEPGRFSLVPLMFAAADAGRHLSYVFSCRSLLAVNGPTLITPHASREPPAQPFFKSASSSQYVSGLV